MPLNLGQHLSGVGDLVSVLADHLSHDHHGQ
jgi:hypothetical protein